jgi:streptogramin lyase
MITAGPDGNLWFTEFNTGGPGIGRITTDGVITEFTTPTLASHPVGITAGPDGNLWYIAGFPSGSSRIGRVTPSGTFTEFPIQGRTGTYGIATGPDGALWVTDYFIVSQYIWRITTSGAITAFPNGRADTSHGVGIVAGPDGNLWFTLGSDTSPNGIGRITTSGSVTHFPIPIGFWPWYIAAGPDGALWFTELDANRIGRITTAGEITEFRIPTLGSEPWGIVAGLDGNLYFTERAGNKIGRITTSGTITEFPIPTPGSGPEGIALGPDGAIWFTENGKNKIGRLSIGPFTCEPDATTMCLNGGRFRVTAEWRSLTASGAGTAVPLTSDSGYFWFFSASNVEVLVKALDGCGFNSRYWVFAAGLTDVEVTLRVTDTQTGALRTYVNPQGTAFQPIQETSAFATCP